jgi:alpha-tubulin suppressor-like RCC1 family protein
MHACALEADGSAWCWGANDAGQLGDGTMVERHQAVAVSGALRFTQIATGQQHTCGLTPDGVVYCWGLNMFGQLGDGTTQSRTVPVMISASEQGRADRRP